METQASMHEETVREATMPTDGSGVHVDWVQSAIASIGCRKEDPEYLKELFEGAKEARLRIDAEFLHELDQQDNK